MLYLFSDYLSLPRSTHAWIVQDILPTGGLSNLYGKPKVGKSFAALQLADAIGDPARVDWLGFPIRTHGLVAYLQLDTPRELWHERLEEAHTHGLSFANVVFTDQLEAPYPFNILGDGFEWLRREIAAISPLAVIIDTLRELHGGDENDSSVMKNVIAAARAACGTSALLFLAHSRKGIASGDAHHEPDITDEMRGSGYVSGRMDCVIRLTNRTVQAKGRAIADTAYAITQDPDTHLLRLSDEFHRKAQELVLRAAPADSDRDIARALCAAHPKRSYESCRSLIRRLRPR
jgi:RecA-family ATPase